MDIKTLRYFVEVVQLQSYTRAAEKLFVTQPTISKMLHNLEDELGFPLLVRHGRKLILTETGQAVYHHATNILSEFRQLQTELQDINQLTKGTLRLGIPPMVGMLMAAPIREFRRQYPGVELKILEFGGYTVQQAVLNGELDVAITIQPQDDLPALGVLPLFDHPLCVLVPRTPEWLHRTEVHIQEIADHPILIYNEDFVLNRQLMSLFAQHQVKPQIAVRSGQWDFLAAMVHSGVGISILPEPICQWLNHPSLMWLPLQSELHWRLGMIWHDGGYLSKSARAWIECCQQVLLPTSTPVIP